MRRVKTVTVLALVAAVSAVWVAGASSASSPGASAAVVNEALVRYCSVLPRFAVGPDDCHAPPHRLALTRKRSVGPCKPRPARCLIYRGMCTADCRVTVRTTLVLPGPNVEAGRISGDFDANVIFEAYMSLNAPARAALKQNRAKARLRTRIAAVDRTTGDTDVDRRTFRIKRG